MKKLNKYLRAALISGMALFLLQLYTVAFVLQPIYRLAGEDQSKHDAVLDSAANQAEVIRYITFFLVGVFLVSLTFGVLTDIRQRGQRKRGS